MLFGENLLAWRRSHHMTQSDLAQAARIAQPSISALEAGHLDPQLSTLRRLSEALHITVGQLVEKAPPRKSWTRHRIEALIRRAMDGKGGLSADSVAHRLRIVASPKLAAVGRPVSLHGRTGKHLVKRLRAELGPEVWKTVVRRLDKHPVILGQGR